MLDYLTVLAEFVSALAWPGTGLIILLFFRRPLMSLANTLAGAPDGRGQRNLRFKMGSVEIESKLQEGLRERLVEIAHEPDAEKRQRMATEPFLAKEAIRAADPQALRALQSLSGRLLKHSAIVNYNYDACGDGVTPERLIALEALGLVQGSVWGDGDELVRITPLGQQVLEHLGADLTSASED